MSRARFECDVCGADQETFTCDGNDCGLKACLNCLGQHEPQCIDRNGSRYQYNMLPSGRGIRRIKRGKK
jgi:hypothetical protein